MLNHSHCRPQRRPTLFNNSTSGETKDTVPTRYPSQTEGTVSHQHLHIILQKKVKMISNLPKQIFTKPKLPGVQAMIIAALSIMIQDTQPLTIVKTIVKESGSNIEVKEVEKDQRGDTTHHENSFTNFKTPTMTITNLKVTKKTGNRILLLELHPNLKIL